MATRYTQPSNSAWVQHPEYDDILRKMVEAGSTALAVATAIGGGMSRSAVLGRASRLGVVFKNSPTLKTAIDAKARKAAKAVADKIVSLTPKQPNKSFDFPLGHEAFRLDGEFVTLETLEPGMCKYPVGSGAALTFCAQPQVRGFPYCSECCKVSYQPAKQKAPVHV